MFASLHQKVSQCFARYGWLCSNIIINNNKNKTQHNNWCHLFSQKKNSCKIVDTPNTFRNMNWYSNLHIKKRNVVTRPPYFFPWPIRLKSIMYKIVFCPGGVFKSFHFRVNNFRVSQCLQPHTGTKGHVYSAVVSTECGHRGEPWYDEPKGPERASCVHCRVVAPTPDVIP